MPRLVALTLVAALGVSSGVPRADAAPPRSAESVASDPISRAQRAWRAGEWSEVRALLEPVVADPGLAGDPARAQTVLPLLADATLSDAGLDPTVRRQAARLHLEHLLQVEPGFRLSEGVYAPELFRLFGEILAEQERAAAERCSVELRSCTADVAQLQRDHERLQKAHAELKKQHAEQLVEVRTQVQRSRAWALVPLGVGHFYSGHKALGAVFLSVEAALGITGIGLLVRRVTVDGCRTRNDQGELVCIPEQGPGNTPDAGAIETRRKAEEAMAWLFLGTVVLDVILAQALFKPSETVSVRRQPRKELDAAPASPPRTRARPQRPRARVRPSPAFVPGGGGVGLHVRF